jgi:glyoxylase-like metal-dependent hydrolase (beta-lactamase superfamily II)
MRTQNGTRCLIASLCCVAGVTATITLPSAWALPAKSPQDRIDAAYVAVGGGKLNTIRLSAHLQQFDPATSYSVSDPMKPDRGESDLVQTRDLVHGLTRNEWVRRRRNGTSMIYTEIITLAAGCVVGVDAVEEDRLPERTIRGAQPEHTMSGRRLTATLRELERPIVVIEMKQHPERISDIADQKVDGRTYGAVQYRGDYGTFIVMFNAETNLPVRVRTLDWDEAEGDSVYDAEYSDWRDIGGAKVPFHTLYTLNGIKIIDSRISDAKVNSALEAGTFSIPPALLDSAARPAASSDTPFQWIIRRQLAGFYLDSDAKYTDDGDSLELVDIGPNISQVRGHNRALNLNLNTIFIATNSYLIAVEAPNDDGQSIQSIDLAKKKYPGKPIRYLILTHHHAEHIGGMRTYAAEGTTIVVAKGNGDYFRQVLARPEKLNPNAPKKAFAAKVIEVDGKWSVNDGGRTVDAYVIDTSHAANFLVPFVPDAKLAVVTDLAVPGEAVRSNAWVTDLVKGMDKWGIKPETFAGGHGTVGRYSEVAAAAQKVPAVTP